MLDEVFPVEAAFINRSTVHEMNAIITRAQICYNEILYKQTEDVRERVWREKELRVLDENTKGFRALLLETFSEPCDSCEYNL